MTRQGFDAALIAAIGEGADFQELLARLRKRGVQAAGCMSLYAEVKDRLQALRQAGHIESRAGKWRLTKATEAA